MRNRLRLLSAIYSAPPIAPYVPETVDEMLEREHRRWLRDKAQRDVKRCRQKFEQGESLKWMRMLG